MECDYQGLQAAITRGSTKCKYANNYCDDLYINFLSVYYCYLEGNIYYGFSFLILMWLICIYVINSISELYISPAIIYINDQFKNHQKFCALTLLAFGSQVSKIITLIIYINNCW